LSRDEMTRDEKSPNHRDNCIVANRLTG